MYQSEWNTCVRLLAAIRGPMEKKSAFFLLWTREQSHFHSQNINPNVPLSTFPSIQPFDLAKQNEKANSGFISFDLYSTGLFDGFYACAALSIQRRKKCISVWIYFVFEFFVNFFLYSENVERLIVVFHNFIALLLWRILFLFSRLLFGVCLAH